MKVFACTAVMMQTVLSIVLKNEPNEDYQILIGILYNLVKFTAPVFIFGILYTTIRTTPPLYKEYLKKQWSALFVPTIFWTLAYLLIFPNLQQVNSYHDWPSFLWQFVNGNAAPHLWYNTMMLQFIILMPLFWFLSKFIRKNANYTSLIIAITTVGYFLWIYFYDLTIFHSVHEENWYLLDRLFISFIIYGIFGTLAWIKRDSLEKFIKVAWPYLILAFIAILVWTNYELFTFGFPIHLADATYYKPSMTLYSLLVIGLITTLAIKQIKANSKYLPLFHFLATYAYRSYLSNVFWLQIIWQLGGRNITFVNPLLGILTCYLLTWLLSFSSAFLFHIIWKNIKRVMP
ncbi:acyltransferase [Companilactobacillus keshanensis]|uniref:Acyltransferase n=1 Tax=Companilactobacillus keshanensis TaxID=2486003 RepID=A0ABW4BUC9_9LACO